MPLTAPASWLALVLQGPHACSALQRMIVLCMLAPKEEQERRALRMRRIFMADPVYVHNMPCEPFAHVRPWARKT